ncbi:MAG: hypothetical protein ACE5ES_01185 [Candidatus Nanoarchaeia archaeon]
MLKKRGQIWVETVIYTLIAFVIIGTVLSFVKPKVEELQDQALIDQSVRVMQDINELITSVIQGGPGNKRLIELGLKKGDLKIDGEKDLFLFEIESRYTYSEPGKNINIGSVIARTEKQGRLNMVSLMSNYSGIYNITFQGTDSSKSIGKAPIPHKIFILNKGVVGNQTQLDVTLG